MSAPTGAPPGAQAAVEIDSADLVRLVMQFLREAGLSRSLRVLQEEANLSLNMVDDLPAFTSDLLAGRWDAVLPQVASLALPPALVMGIYEQVVRELAEGGRDAAAARTLLKGALPLLMLKTEEPERFARLDALVARAQREGGAAVDAAAAYGEGESKEARRAALARSIGDHLVSVPPSRLVSLLSQALRWQAASGTLPAGARLDIYRGIVPLRRDAEEMPVAVAAGVIRGGAQPQCVSFAADGASLDVGSDDGLLEVFDPDSAALRKDLSFQAADEFMLHDEAITAVALSPDGAVLASASRDGKLKAWALAKGECVRRFAGPQAASLAFSRDGSRLLTGGFDGIARAYGLRSGKVLKEFRGHTSFVNSVAFMADGETVVTASSDGTVRLWDSRALEALAVLRPPQASAAIDTPVLAAVPLHGAVASAAAAAQAAATKRGARAEAAVTAAAGGAAAGAAGGAGLRASLRSQEALLVASRAPAAHIIASGGACTGVVLCTLKHERPAPAASAAAAGGGSGGGGAAAAAASTAPGSQPPPRAVLADVVACAVASQGRVAYLLLADRALLAYSFGSGSAALPLSMLPVSVIEAATAGEPLALAVHPLRNLAATVASDGAVRLWKP